MSRPKTITDEEILAVARESFRAHGFVTSTRQIAEAAGVSEGVLYQRFKSKDELFFAAMVPSAPDLEEILGPEVPAEDAHAYVKSVVLRMATHFGEVLPLALRIMTHPSFDRASLGDAQATTAKLQDGLSGRLTWFAKQKQLRRSAAEPTARLLVSVAHDWALGQAMSASSGPKSAADLQPMIDIIWKGIAPPPAATT